MLGTWYGPENFLTKFHIDYDFNWLRLVKKL